MSVTTYGPHRIHKANGVAQWNNTRKALIAAWLRDSGNDSIREAIDHLDAAIVALGRHRGRRDVTMHGKSIAELTREPF
jgi:hypothetical protein